MMSMHKWQRIQAMKRSGAGIKRIARELGLSRNTVRKYLSGCAPPTFGKRTYPKKIDLYADKVSEMMEKGYIGTRIYSELRQTGYEGSLAAVHRFLRTSKHAQKRAELSTTRVETLPGYQMQYDWKEWRLPVAGKLVKVYIHELVLSYSRKQHYTCSLSITSQDVIRAIEEGVTAFGGTARELVIDNPKQMVLAHRLDRVVCYTEEFLKFCGVYGIEPDPCMPYRARTKGKVERPFYYLQEHLLRGLEVSDVGEFQRKLTAFTEQANARRHSSFGESPDERFLRERERLMRLPVVEPTLLYSREPRRVSNDGYISYRGAWYPVPMVWCLSEVWVECVLGRLLRVYDPSGQLVSEQPVSLDGGRLRPEHPEHQVMNEGYGERKAKARSVVVSQFIARFGAVGEEYLAGLRERVGGNVYWHLSEMLGLCELYASEEVGRVLQECLHIGAYHKNSVLRLLGSQPFKGPLGATRTGPGVFPKGELIRGLSCYAGLGEVSHA